MSINRTVKALRFHLGSTVVSIAAILFGIFLVYKPKTTTSLLFLVGGILLTGFGLYKIFCHLLGGKRSIGYELLPGLISLAAGLVCIVFNRRLLGIGPYLIGIGLLLSGIWKFTMSSAMRNAGSSRWGVTMLTACISAVMGIILMANPFATVWMLTRAVGVVIIVESVQNLFVSRTYTGLIETSFND